MKSDCSIAVGVEMRIILKLIINRTEVLNSPGSGQRQVANCCECGNEPSSSTKCGEFLD